MYVYSLAELCRQEEALRVGTLVIFSPSELGQHYRDGVSSGEHIRKGNINAVKIDAFPNVLYSLCFPTLSTSYEPEHFLFIELLVGKHCKAITFVAQLQTTLLCPQSSEFGRQFGSHLAIIIYPVPAVP